MARWSNSTLVALGGFDKNVIIDELLYGEDNYYDMTFLADLQRTVQSINGDVVTFKGGDNGVFSPYVYVSFGDKSELYEILSVGTNTITLDRIPAVPPINGEAIQSPIDLRQATFQFRLLEHTADINDDSRNGVTISNIVPKQGATTINLDGNILTDVPGKLAELGQVRILINVNDLTTSPMIDTLNPPLYTGYIGATLPGPDQVTPSQVKKQRICFIIRADGVNT